MTLFHTLFRRLGQSWRWLLVQLLLTPVLLGLGVVWMRLPEKNFLEVAATFLLPFLLIVSFLELQAGTMRTFATDDGSRVKLVWGAIWLVAAAFLLWIGWGLADNFANHSSDWASYLNSQSPLHTRLFTYERYQHSFNVIGWILTWILVPGLVLPVASSAAQWGRLVPWRRVARLLIDWKWWAAVTLAALLAELIPSFFYHAPPSGSVLAQEWHVGLKLCAAYLLKLIAWVLILAWCAVLFDRIPETPRSLAAERFCRNLRVGWRLLLAVVGLILLVCLPVWPFTMPDHTASATYAVVTEYAAMTLRLTASIAAFVLLILHARRMFPEPEKKAKIYWGILAAVLSTATSIGAASLTAFIPFAWLKTITGDFVIFALFPPFVISAAVWGWLLPWKRILRLYRNPRWWTAGVTAFIAQTYFASQIAELFVTSRQSRSSSSGLHDFVAMTLSYVLIVFEVAWIAALLAPRPLPLAWKIDEPEGVTIGPSDPERSTAIKLDPPE